MRTGTGWDGLAIHGVWGTAERRQRCFGTGQRSIIGAMAQSSGSSLDATSAVGKFGSQMVERWDGSTDTPEPHSGKVKMSFHDRHGIGCGNVSGVRVFFYA